jgi:hypothetical protein
VDVTQKDDSVGGECSLEENQRANRKAGSNWKDGKVRRKRSEADKSQMYSHKQSNH